MRGNKCMTTSGEVQSVETENGGTNSGEQEKELRPREKVVVGGIPKEKMKETETNLKLC
jgi:hypothetical protein